MSEQSAYAAAGVDIKAGDRAVELMKTWVAKTRRPEVMGDIGGFAGLFDANALAQYAHPVLAASTDGTTTVPLASTTLASRVPGTPSETRPLALPRLTATRWLPTRERILP